MASDQYDNSPALLDVPLGIDDVEALIANGGKGLLGQKRALMHFLRRVAVTLRATRKQMLQLNQAVLSANTTRETRGTATTLDPMDAARFLTPAQLEMLFEGSMRERLGAMDRAYGEVNSLRQNLHRDVNRVNFLLASIRDDTELPPEIRSRAASALAQAPASPGPDPVPVPAGIQGASAALRPAPPTAAPSPSPARAEAPVADPSSLPPPTGAPVLPADETSMNAAAAGAQRAAGAPSVDEHTPTQANPLGGLFG